MARADLGDFGRVEPVAIAILPIFIMVGLPRQAWERFGLWLASIRLGVALVDAAVVVEVDLLAGEDVDRGADALGRHRDRAGHRLAVLLEHEQHCDHEIAAGRIPAQHDPSRVDVARNLSAPARSGITRNG